MLQVFYFLGSTLCLGKASRRARLIAITVTMATSQNSIFKTSSHELASTQSNVVQTAEVLADC